MRAVPNILRHTFDSIAAARRATSIDDLNKVVGEVLKPLGYTVFVGVNAVDANKRPNVRILFGETHKAWESHYQQNQYFRHDAVIGEMLSSPNPLFWSDLQERRNVTAAEQKVLNEAGDFGLKEGFMTPIYHMDGSISAVLLMGERLETQDPDLLITSEILSIYYATVAQRLRISAQPSAESEPAPVCRLSKRQRECLQWVREGKSSNDIGDILGLSARTVDEYLATACARLDVHSRFQAVSKAADTGLLQL